MNLLKSLIGFLNQDSGAISALATVTYAVATIALIYWTIKYVRLTRSLAASSAELVEHTLQERKQRQDADRHGLHELVKIVLLVLNRLPSSRARMEVLLSVTLWTEEDLLDMRRLARGLGSQAIGHVFWAIYHLNMIRERVLRVQQDHLDREKELREFPWDDYVGALTQAKHELGHLLERL